METPAWMGQCYQMMQALRFEHLEVSGFLLGKKQYDEMWQFLREQESLCCSPAQIGDFSFSSKAGGDRLWGKPIVWSDAGDSAVPLMRQGVDVHYDEAEHRNRLAVGLDVYWAR